MLLAVKTGSKLWSGLTLLCIFASSVAAAPVDATESSASDDATDRAEEISTEVKPGKKNELHRWVPSVAIISGIGAQKVQGTLTTTNVVGHPVTAPLPPPGVTIQPIVPGTPMTARTWMVTPYIGGSFEVMTPAWIPVASSPRLYAHVDVSYAFGPEYFIPKIGDPGEFVAPTNITNFTATTIRGQGGTLSAELDPLLVMAGFGLAFTFETGDRTWRVKPSFEYIREQVNILGNVRRAVGPNSANGGGTSLALFRPITLTVDESQVYHGLGAGLEAELDTARAGPFMLTLFLNGKAWNFLDNQMHTYEDANIYGEAAFFQFLKNEWAFGFAMGLRFRWVPE